MGVIVLVHGAFEGGWCWSRVAKRLRGQGHDVYTPTLTGSGERFHLLSRNVDLATHIEDVAAVLRYEDLSEALLVGHSYGGTVITGVADKERHRLRRLVYLDGSAPVNGQSASGSFAEGTSAKLIDMAASDSWLLPPLPAWAVGVSEPQDVLLLETRRHPHPTRTLFEPLQLREGDTHVPRTYVSCTRHEGLTQLFGVDPLAPFLERARSERWDVREIETGHEAMLTAPETVAQILLEYV